MAEQVQGQFGYQTVQLVKNQPLGTGSYGAVYKAKCDELPCAAKILHPTLFQFSDPGAMTVMRRFEQECSFLSATRHPNIVQYLGSYRDPNTQLPVLLMELMDESLTQFLERSQEPLPYYTEVDLCYDIALALAYLHSNAIIHRDLSSNNVLLNSAGNQAKITDFGMAKFFDKNGIITPLTMCPGTHAYMPPEALTNPPVYSTKLDCFSSGVLVIQIMTRQFPDPGPQVQVVEDPQSPTGRIHIPVPETERRSSHIDLIISTHPLLPIATACLSYNEEDRPSAQELCHRLAALKETPQYGGSVRQARETNQPALSVTADGEGRERQIRELQQEKEELQQQQEERDQQIRDLQQQIQDYQAHFQAKEAVIAARQEELLQLRQELELATCDKLQQIQEKDCVVMAKERLIRELQQEKEELQWQQEERDQQIRDLQQQLQASEQWRVALTHKKNAGTAAIQQRVQQLRNELENTTLKNDQKIEQKDCVIAKQHRQIQENHHVIEAREKQLRELNQQQEASEKVTAEFLLHRGKMVKELQEKNQHLQQELQLNSASNNELLRQPTATQTGKLNLNWKTSKEAPCRMQRGSAAVLGRMVYLKADASSKIQAYNSCTEEWSVLPESPTHTYNFTLTVVNDLLTAVGGMQYTISGSAQAKSTILSLVARAGGKMKWVKHFPPMPTKRSHTTVVSSGKALVVAGGRGEGVATLTTVEVMDTETLQWSTACRLPQPLSNASATVCGDNVYLVGGYGQCGMPTRIVLCCSLSALLQSQTMIAQKSLPLAENHQVWNMTTDLPMKRSTCITLNGHVLAIGGSSPCLTSDIGSVYIYNTAANSWEIISHMPTSRSLCLVALLPGNKLMVVGGRQSSYETDTVQIATAVE